MNRAKRTRIWITVLVLLFFIIGGINFMLNNIIYRPSNDECVWTNEREGILISGIVVGGVTGEAGIKEGDFLVKIDGRSFDIPTQAQVYINSLPEGQTARYTIRRGEQLLELDVRMKKPVNYFSIVATVVGFVFLLTGYLVLIFNPLKRLSRTFFYLCFVTFLFVFFNQISFQPRLLFYIFRGIQLLSVILWAPAILHFFSVFPSKKAIVIKYPRLFYLIYLPQIIVVALSFIFPRFGIIINYMIGLYIILSFYLFITEYHKVKGKKEKKALRIILWGMFLGFTPLGLLILSFNFLVGLIGITAVLIGLGMMVFLPISFGYAVMKYGLMDVTIVVKKGIVYSITTGFFILLYMGLVVGLGGILAREIGVKSEILYAFFIAIVALALNPVKEKIQQFVDKRFYPQKYNYRKMLLGLSQDLPTLIKLDEILKKVSQTLQSAVQVKEILISVFESEKEAFRIYNRIGVPESCECDFLDYSSGLSRLLSQKKSCVTFYKMEDEPEFMDFREEEREEIKSAGLVLAIPMFMRDRLKGMILLGAKISGDIYTQEELDILLTVAGQTAVAVENARLYLKELQQQRAEAELKIAQRIQQNLLPKEPPQVKGLEIAGCSLPATEVGGDYFDYILQNNRRLIVFVGDVSGKGMPAALYMSKVQGMVQMAGSLYHSPKDILKEVNRRIIHGIDKSSFITMLSVLFDLKKKQAIIARAGHTPLLLKKSNREGAEVILPKGLGLGITSGEDFDPKIEEVTIPMQSNDCFVLFSDGLTEAMNPNHELFGEERVMTLLNQNHNLSSQEFRNLLLSQAGKFRENEEQNDDITVVVVKVR
jgi:sigma-B regulation protein RsbU (phosphoserine phosphatase)